MPAKKNITRSKSIRRVIIGFFILIAIFGISELLSFRNLKQSKEISARNLTILQPSIIQLSELQLLIVNSEDYSDSWVFFDITDHEDKRKLIELHQSGFDQSINELNGISSKWDKQSDKQLLEQVFLKIDTVREAQVWIMESLSSIEDYSNLIIYVEAEGEHLEKIKRLSGEIDSQLNSLIKSFKHQSKTEEKKAQSALKLIETFHLILAIVAFVIAVIVAWTTIRATRLEEQKRTIQAERDKINSQKVLVEEKNNEILSSLNYAKRLQSSMLPASIQFQSNFREHFVMYKPRDIVSGDFYWLRKVDTSTGEILLVAAADATGHGVPGAFVSFVCYSSLNRSMDEFELITPARILDKTSELVAQTFSSSDEVDIADGMDISLLSFDLNSRTLIFSGAHNGALIIRNDEIIHLKGDRKSVGKDYNTEPFSEQRVQLEVGDNIYIFSDGFADQFGGNHGKKFMLKNLIRFLQEVSRKPMNEQHQALEASLTNWKGEMEQLDDILVIGMRV